MRFGIALALICCVVAALYVGPAFRKAAEQLSRHAIGSRLTPSDLKSTFHAEGTAK